MQIVSLTTLMPKYQGETDMETDNTNFRKNSRVLTGIFLLFTAFSIPTAIVIAFIAPPIDNYIEDTKNLGIFGSSIPISYLEDGDYVILNRYNFPAQAVVKSMRTKDRYFITLTGSNRPELDSHKCLSIRDNGSFFVWTELPCKAGRPMTKKYSGMLL
ncbi:MAG: hypothetical protein ABH832_01390 [bacterium]